jgi:hypothetical protein
VGGRTLLALALRARLLALLEGGAGDAHDCAPGDDGVAAAAAQCGSGEGETLPRRALCVLQRQLRVFADGAQRAAEGPALLRALLAWWAGASGGGAAALRGAGALLVAALGAPPLVELLPEALFPVDSAEPALPLKLVTALAIPPPLLLAAAAPRLEKAQLL